MPVLRQAKHAWYALAFAEGVIFVPLLWASLVTTPRRWGQIRDRTLALFSNRKAPMRRLFSALSGEWMLRNRANGGDIVFIRSLLISTIMFLIAIVSHEWLAPNAKTGISWRSFTATMGANLPWYGAIFAATYAALYTRFASQWTYLAGLYNQIMAARTQVPPGKDAARDRVFAIWWAAFVEDAQDVHLALKPSYATVIAGLLGDQEVVRIYESATLNGSERLSSLERSLEEALGTEVFQRRKAEIKSQTPTVRD
jgi:hypothetical protein